jgi:hypothetical protein
VILQPKLIVRRTILLTGLFIFLTGNSFAARTERLIDSWRPTNYNVALAFDESLTEITTAKADITVLSLKDSLTQIDFDFGELPIDAVAINDLVASYRRSDRSLTVTLAQPLRKGASLVVVISYHGKPKDGLILSVDKAGKPPWSGTIGQIASIIGFPASIIRRQKLP